MKIIIPVTINLDTYGAVKNVLNCINDWFEDNIDDELGIYNFTVPDEDENVIRKNFTIDVLEEALKKVKEK